MPRPPPLANTRATTAISTARRETIGEKYTTREPTSGRYSPGRYTPHAVQTPTLRLLLPTQQAQANKFQVRSGPQPKAQPQQTLLKLPSVSMSKSSDWLLDPPQDIEFPEHEYFMRTPSQITPFLYVSSYNPTLDKSLLKHQLLITHIINCTGSPNAFPDHFEYLQLKLHDENYQDILQPLPRSFEFIRDALSHNGRVLIYSDKVFLSFRKLGLTLSIRVLVGP